MAGLVFPRKTECTQFGGGCGRRTEATFCIMYALLVIHGAEEALVFYGYKCPGAITTVIVATREL